MTFARDDMVRRGPEKWTYRTTDGLSTVLAAGYFNDVHALLEAGDTIDVSLLSDLLSNPSTTALSHVSLLVSSLSGGTVTTESAAQSSLGLINVRDYGAVGDGVTDDRAAIQAALDVIEAVGYGRLMFEAGKTYNLGSMTADNTQLLRIDDVVNFVFDGNGCTFTCNITGTVGKNAIIRAHNSENCTFRNYHVEDAGFSGTGDTIKGAVAASIAVNGSGATYRGFHFENISCNGAAALVEITRGDTGTSVLTDITGTGLRANDCGYPLLAYRCGTNISIDFVAQDCHRAMWLSGTQGAHVNFLYTGTGTGVEVGVVMAVHQDGYPDLTDTHIRGVIRGDIGTSDLIYLFNNSANTSPPTGHVNDVSFDLDCRGLTSYGAGRRVCMLRSYQGDTVTEITGAQTSGMYFDNVGVHVRMPRDWVPTNNGGPIEVRAWDSNTVRLMDVSGSSLNSKYQVQPNGFRVIDGNSWFRVRKGDLTAATLDLPVREGVHFAWRVETFMESDQNPGGKTYAADVQYVIGHADNTTGTVSINAPTSVFHDYRSGYQNCTVAFTASTTNVRATFTPAGGYYNSADSHAMVRVTELKGP